MVDQHDMWHKAWFDALRSANYNTMRHTFFQRLSILVSSLVILSGLSATGPVLGAWNALPYAGFVVAALGVLQITFGWSDVACRHKILAKQYFDIAARLEGEPNLSVKKISELRAEMARLSPDEGPQYRALDVIAFNQSCRSTGVDEREMIPISLWRRVLANFCRFPGWNP